MAVDQYGIQTTVQGFSTFVQQLGAASAATQKLGTSITQATSQINKFGAVKTAVGGLPSVVSGASAALGGLGSVLTGILTVAGGILAAGIFRRIAQEITGLVTAAFVGAAAFQTLQIRLEGLIARQLRNSDATLTLSRSLEIAADKAQEYLRWVQDLALSSPFATQDVANIFSLAQAYDFTAEEAKKLTQSVTDFAAGMGLSGEAMTRIIENFGQMRAAGKVTGTELRDLARGAFVPVNDILHRMAENLNVAAADFEDFKTEAKQGGADVEEFFKAFQQLVDEDFAGAAKRMSRTWAGVTNNVRDFIETVVGMQVLGPILQSFTDIAADALDFLLSDEVRNNAQLFGDALGSSFDKIWASISGQLLPALQQLAAAFGLSLPSITSVIAAMTNFSTFIAEIVTKIAGFISTIGVDIAGKISEIASNAYTWGMNIVGQLAQGIIQGGASLLVAAMQWIGQMLANWLQPGSPPKVALGILKWGAGTFEEYLKGFAKADFGVLNDLQSPLKSALDILTQAGAIGEEDAAGMFAGISENIAAAIAQFNETGEINGDVFSALDKEAGAFGEELQTLLGLELAYAGAVEAVEAAQAALNRAQLNQKDAQGQVKSLTEEYNKLLRAGADESILRSKLAEINAAEQARALAIEQSKAAEEALSNAEDAVGPIKDQIEAQKELIAQLLELARIQASAGGTTAPGADPETPGGGAGSGGAPEIGLPDIDVAPLTDLLTGFTNFLEGWRAKVASIFASLITPWSDTWNTIWSIVSTIWGIVVEFVTKGLETMLRIWNKHKGQVEQIWRTFWHLVDSIASDILVLIRDNINERLHEIEKFFEDNRGKITKIINLFWKNFETVADLALDAVLGFVQERLDAIQLAWDTWSPPFLASVDSTWDNVSEIIGTVMQQALNTVEKNLESVERFWVEHGGSVKTIVDNFMKGLGFIFDSTLNAIGRIVERAMGIIAGWWEKNKEDIKEIVRLFFEGIQTAWDDGLELLGNILDLWAAGIKLDWETFKQELLEIWDSFWKLVGGIVETAKELIKEAVDILLSGVDEKFAGWIEILKAKWSLFWNDINTKIILAKAEIVETARQLWADVQAKFEEVTGQIKTNLDAWIGVIKANWFLFLNTIKTEVALAKTGITTAFEDIFNGVKTVVETIWGKIKTAFNLFLENDLLQAVVNFISDFYTAGKNLVQAIIDGMVSQGTAMFDALKALIMNAINDALEALGLPPLEVGGGTTGGGGGTSLPPPIAKQVIGNATATLATQAREALAPTARGEAPMMVKNIYLTFNTEINDGMDAAEYQAFVKKTIDNML